MEKFNTWADPRTGIQPFLPPTPCRYTSTTSKIFYWLRLGLLGPILVLLRLPFVLTLFLLLWVAETTTGFV